MVCPASLRSSRTCAPSIVTPAGAGEMVEGEVGGAMSKTLRLSTAIHNNERVMLGGRMNDVLIYWCPQDSTGTLSDVADPAPELDRARLAEAVERRRKMLGLSISAAARAAGIDRATWTGTERGTRRTEEYNFAAIERALGWAPGSVDAILSGGAPTIEGTAQANLGGLTATARGEVKSDLPAEVVEDLDMILGLDLPASTRLRMIRQVVALHEQAKRETANHGQHEPPAERHSA